MRHRVQLVRTASMVKNRVHSLLDKYGVKHGFSDFSVRLGWSGLGVLSLSLWIGFYWTVTFSRSNALRG